MIVKKAVKKIAVGVLASLLATAASVAADFKPVLLYDIGGQFDKSFNEAAYNGAEAFKAEFGDSYRDFEPSSETQYEQALKRFARRKADLIVAVGIGYSVAVRNVAAKFPDVHFTVIDAIVDLPNVQSITFKENEGSFLVGMIAAMKTQSKNIGFIGGMDIPLIRRFEHGYRQGAEYVRSDLTFVQNYVGTTPSAWTDPIKASEMARSQYARGVDIIFAAAGPSGIGVIQAAKDNGKLAIGVDSNQNYLAPGSVLTSMLKRVDLVVQQAMKEAKEGTWVAGHRIMGLKEGGVDFAVDEHNEMLFTDEMKAKLDDARAKIIGGEIIVTDIKGSNTGH